MQAKPSHFRYLHPKGIKANRSSSSQDGMVCSVPTVGALGEHPAPLLRTDGYPVTDRATQYLLHRVFVALFQVQVTVFFIALKDSLSLQKSSNPVADRMHQFCQFLLIRCVGSTSRLNLNSIAVRNLTNDCHCFNEFFCALALDKTGVFGNHETLFSIYV